MKVVLYHYWRSSASWRLRWGINLKKLPVELRAVNLLSGEEKQEEYKKLNPAGYLPCLVVDGRPPLAESLAILEWMEENCPSPSFFHGDSYQRAFIRQLAETVNAGTQPLQNLDVMKRVSEEKEKQQEWVKHWITRGLSVYERLLEGVDRKGKKFSVSDHPTLADLCLIPQVYSAHRFEVDMKQFPQCKAIYDFALTTPECADSAPEKHQPA